MNRADVDHHARIRSLGRARWRAAWSIVCLLGLVAVAGVGRWVGRGVVGSPGDGSGWVRAAAGVALVVGTLAVLAWGRRRGSRPTSGADDREVTT